MRTAVVQRAARQMRAVFFSGGTLASAALAHAAGVAPAAPAAERSAAGPHKSTVTKKTTATADPSWEELTPAQKHGLAPL
jgi:hypothetical protein